MILPAVSARLTAVVQTFTLLATGLLVSWRRNIVRGLYLGHSEIPCERRSKHENRRPFPQSEAVLHATLS